MLIGVRQGQNQLQTLALVFVCWKNGEGAPTLLNQFLEGDETIFGIMDKGPPLPFQKSTLHQAATRPGDPEMGCSIGS